MRIPPIRATTVGFLPLLALGCGDPGRATDPAAFRSGPLADATQAHANLPARPVTMMDACDPATFNEVIGPGTCVNRHGGVTFEQFIAELSRTQKVGSWHNAPPSTKAGSGQTLVAVNRGGEPHTFTRVAQFGGGIVPVLNVLSGNPIPAPECLTLSPADFVAAGAAYEIQLGGPGTERFECCLHPWMRTTVQVH